MAKVKEEIFKDKKKSLKEKEKIKKEQELRLKKRIKAEKKKLDKITSFPFKSLLIVGSVSGILFALYNFYLEGNTLLSSVFKGFFLFAIVYFGLGIIFLIWFFIIAKARQKEAEEKKQAEEELLREKERIAIEGKLEREQLLREAQEKRDAEIKKLRDQLENK